MKGSVAVLGGAASVLVAVYSVQEQIDANAQEGRINRSFTLYDKFITSESVNYLMALSGFIELEFDRIQMGLPAALPEAKTQEIAKTLSARLNAARIEEEFYKHMTHLLRQSSAIARCAGYADEADARGLAPAAMCDRETLSNLLGESIVDLFFTLRPTMYCADYLKNFSSGIREIEVIVSAYFQERGFKVYKTVEESAGAPGDGRYVVLEFGPDEHCAPFDDEAQTVALTQRTRSG